MNFTKVSLNENSVKNIYSQTMGIKNLQRSKDVTYVYQKASQRDCW